MLSFSRNPGDLETSHGLANRRDLLPYEAELCNTVGISPEDYFGFLAEANAVVVKREGYEHIPDVQNELTTLTIIQIVVGLALTAASVLMQPKAAGKGEERIDIKRPDQIGPNRFTPTFAFDTVQELARLGQTVPLVFANQVPPTDNQQENADISVLTGGTRANSLMTFSMLSSTGGGQRLRVYGVAGFCGGADNQFGQAPDYEGLAFGDQLIRDYNPGRIAAYFRGEKETGNVLNDGPIQKDNQYRFPPGDPAREYQLEPPEGDPSKVYWHPDRAFTKAFCGARNPSNETEFGAYSPMPNGNYWKLDFQMFILPDAADSDEKDRIRSIRDKISSAFPLYAAIIDITGDIVTYRIDSRDDEYENLFNANGDVTADDIKNQINQQRSAIDAALNEGETYLLNNQVGLLITKTEAPFVPGSQAVECTFRMLPDGSGSPPTIMQNNTTGCVVEDLRAYGRGVQHWADDANQIQRFSDAIIANNVACDCTEIGIGSTVWKKFQGANVNNFPGGNVMEDLENNDAGGTYDIGRLDAYVTRYSFFNIQVRRQGATDWSDNVSGNGVFAVKGNTPTERFNAIRIYHPKGQYEFRLRPYPSKLAYYNATRGDKPIYVLEARKGLDDANSLSGSVYVPDPTEGFAVWFEGRLLNLGGPLDVGLVTNKESVKGFEGSGLEAFEITSVAPTTYKPDNSLGDGLWPNNPSSDNPKYVGPTYSDPTFDNNCARFLVQRRNWYTENRQRWVYFWDGIKVGEQYFDGNELPSRDDLVAYQITDPTPECGAYPENNNIRYQPGGLSNEPIYKEVRSNGNEVTFYKVTRKVRLSTIPPDGPVQTARAIGGSGSGLIFNLQKYLDGSYTWAIRERGSSYKNGETVTLKELNNNNVLISLYGTNEINLDDFDNDPDWWDSGDTAPLSMITDYYHHNFESSSHKDRPEHRVTYVNEFVLAPDTAIHGNYKYLASLGFTLNSSKQLTSLTQLSAYYQKGLRVQKIGKDYNTNRNIGASNLFPEIAYFLLTNDITGAGGIISKAQIDLDSFARAADFCRANGYYWDGVIDERVNLREFIHEQASYCLLDFTMKGGRFGLEPAVPYNSDFTIKEDENAIPEIKALFSDGNIRELQVTTLPPEERKLFTAEVLYREERINQYPQTRTTSFRLERYPNTMAIETFDLTQFCTSRRQVSHFAKFALKTRQYIDHVIEFQTTPQSMANVEPGDYIRVVSHLCHPDRFATGHITDEGVIQSSQDIQNGTQVYYWNPSFTKDAATNSFIRVGSISITDGKAQNALRGCVFAVVSSTTTDRVYKVDSIAIGDEGFVAVTGTHMPIGEAGQLKIMTGWGEDADFIINSTL